MKTPSVNSRQESFDQVRRLAGAELSLMARLGYVALLLGAVAMTAVVVSLWLTEPALPARTELAFGVMTVIGASWTAFSVWVLSRRRPLFARDRVIAGRMAVAFTAVFFVAALVVTGLARSAASLAMLGSGAVMLALAIRVSMAARRRFSALAARRQELEAQGH